MLNNNVEKRKVVIIGHPPKKNINDKQIEDSKWDDIK